MTASGADGSAEVLVTGAGSFVGNYIVRHLTDLGIRVTAVYRTPTPQVELMWGRANPTLVRGDLSDPAFLESLSPCSTGLIHAAASSPGPGISGAQMIRDNALATAGLVDYALRADCPRFVLLSSMSVYGEVRESRISAVSEIRSPGMYGLTKRAAELLLEERSDDLPSVAVRLPAVLGYGARSHWLARLVADARAGRDIEIANPTAPFNNAIHQVDLCRFMVTLLGMEFEAFRAFPVASSAPIPVAEVVSTVLTATDSQSSVRVIKPNRTAFAIDDAYARRDLGYESLAIEEAVRKYAIEEASAG